MKGSDRVRGGQTPGDGGGEGAAPSFALSLNPPALAVRQGNGGQINLKVTPRNGFTGTVNLDLVDGSGNPVPGITLSPTSVTVGSGPVTQALTVSVASSASPGTYNLQVRGTSGSLTRGAGLSLTVSTAGGGGGGGGGGAPGATWTVRNLRAPLISVTHGNGLFVAVGQGGTILTSPDGVTWTPRASGTGVSLCGVTHGNGLFVAVGDGGTILTSRDGVTWTRRASGTTEDLYAVTHGNGLFVAVGDGGTILTSPDGVAWTPRTSGTTAGLRGVTHGDGLFVAVGW